MITCDQCTAKCCRYIATEIDAPEDMEDYDQIRWFLLHENVSVFIDEDDEWFLEFQTNCKALDGNACRIYRQRPQICREHKVETCEVNGEGEAHKIRFEDTGSFEKWMSEHYSFVTKTTTVLEEKNSEIL